MLWLDRIKWAILSCGTELSAFYRKLGVRDRRYEKLRELQNRHRGKRCFICATGPSLTLADVEMLKDEYVFGVNSICAIYSRTDWRPQFYVFQDYPIYEMYGEIFNENGKTLVFSGDPLVSFPYSKRIKIKERWVRFPLNWAYHTYAGRKGRPFVYFSDNCYERVYSGYTVTYSAIQLAMYMGFEEIYLLGVDCDYKSGKKNHFMKMKNEAIRSSQVARTECEYQSLAYQKARQMAEERNVHIYNASRGGKLEVFPRKKLEEVLKNEKGRV